MRDAVKNRGMFNVIDHESGFKADFMILKNHHYRQAEFSRRTPFEFMDMPVSIVSAEDLLLSKIIWIQDLQSQIQMEDIRVLKSLENLDWIYING